MAVDDSGVVAGPAGFGRGCKSGDVEIAGGETGGRRNEITGGSVAGAGVEGEGVKVGGRRTGPGGAREGRTIRVVSRFGAFSDADAWAVFGGRAIRTVSFLGSAISSADYTVKVAQNFIRCHLLNW
jgi:hypothetical protein